MYQMNPMNWMMIYILVNLMIILTTLSIYWMKIHIKWQ